MKVLEGDARTISFEIIDGIDDDASATVSAGNTQIGDIASFNVSLGDHDNTQLGSSLAQSTTPTLAANTNQTSAAQSQQKILLNSFVSLARMFVSQARAITRGTPSECSRA